MEREKQISEITEILCEQNGYIHSSDYFLVDAEAIFKAGYRKVEQGEWEMVKYPLTKCSNCDVVRNCEIDTGWKYCPECGAHMKGAE